MAPKKKNINAFSLFMLENQKLLSEEGIRMSMSEMPKHCKKKWEKLPDHIKAKYKIQAKCMKSGEPIDKYTNIGEKVEDVQKDTQYYKSHANAMYNYIEELVQMDEDGYYLPRQKLIFVHINSYNCDKENFYFPAEVTMVEYSLERGVIRIIHELLGFNKTLTLAPVAPIADINNHAKNNHQITTFTKLPIDYKATFFRLISFIIEQDVTDDMFHDADFDLPPIYTAHNSMGNEIMVTSASFYQLYKSAINNPMDKADFNNILKVYQLDKLFMEVKNKAYSISNKGINEKALPSVALASDALMIDMLNTIQTIGCDFHHKLQLTHVCSNYFVCKWIFIFSTHCCLFFDITLRSGVHYDFDLDKLILPNVQDIRRDMENLEVSNSFLASFEKGEKKSSAEKFPTLGGKPTVVQQTTWAKPSKPVDPAPSKKGNNFPPLSGTKTNVREQKPTVNSWAQNSGREGGTKVQDNNMVPSGRKPADQPPIPISSNDFPPLG